MMYRITQKADQAYRDGLMAAARKLGGPKAPWHFSNALDRGPRKNGAEESLMIFGGGNSERLNAYLLTTVPLVESLEVAMPGFGQWLGGTGFANDPDMIKGFLAWVNHAGIEHFFSEDADRVRYRVLDA